MSIFAHGPKKATIIAMTGSLALAISATAWAGIPALEFDINVSNGYSMTFNPTGSDLSGGVYNFQGQIINPDFVISWDLNAQPGLVPFGQLQSNFTIESLTPDALDFSIVMTLPMDASTGATQYTGSSAWSLTGIDGNLSTLPGTPLWQATLDGAVIDSLYPDPSGISFAGVGSGDLSGPPLAGLAGGFNDSIGITLTFSLSGEDTAITTGVLNVIPTPGALALLGLGMLGTRRRRR